MSGPGAAGASEDRPLNGAAKGSPEDSPRPHRPQLRTLAGSRADQAPAEPEIPHRRAGTRFASPQMSGPGAAGASEDRPLNGAAKGSPKIHPGLTDRNCGPTPGVGLTSRRQGRGGGRDKAEEPRHDNQGAANDRANTPPPAQHTAGRLREPRRIDSKRAHTSDGPLCVCARAPATEPLPASLRAHNMSGGGEIPELPPGATRRFLLQAASRNFRCGSSPAEAVPRGTGPATTPTAIPCAQRAGERTRIQLLTHRQYCLLRLFCIFRHIASRAALEP